MAKLKAPLLSLGASGKLGDAIVYFPWKGLNVAREYVIPSNPQTKKQNTQRSYLTQAVYQVHEEEKETTKPFGERDAAAYSLWASTFAKPLTWFNQAVKCCINQLVASKQVSVYRGGEVAEMAGELQNTIYSVQIRAGRVITGNWHYGTSKTAMLNVVSATMNLGANSATFVKTGLTKGVKYYMQFVCVTSPENAGSKSGIYYGTPT